MRLLPAALMTLVISASVSGQGYSISTFAGGAMLTDVPGTSVTVGTPPSVAVDRLGNLFFVDRVRNMVLRLDAATGLLSVVAGNGFAGSNGDNGPAASAQLNAPWGVVVDLAGAVYIGDTNNNRIRKVVNGIITTVAGNGSAGYGGDGGPAASASLNHPNGITLDSAGNLYIADTNNQRIRKITNGIISTVAGNGTAGFSGDAGPAPAAQLSSPWAVAVDAAGNLYVADTNNYRIRKVSNAVISTVAGNGSGFFAGDGGPATDGQLNYPSGVAVDSAGNLYIADTWNSRIRKVANGVITTLAGMGTGSITGVNNGSGFSGDGGPAVSAQLKMPTGVAVDFAGNVYVADASNNRIRKVSNSVITTVAGNGTKCFGGDSGPASSAQLCGPWGVAADSAGNVYIADTGNNRIRKVAKGVITTIAGSEGIGYIITYPYPAASALLSSPQAVGVDFAGNVYIADTGVHRIEEVANGLLTLVAGADTRPGFGGDDGPAIKAQFNSPWAVAVDSAGNVYIADTYNNRIRKVTNGVITTVAGNGTPGFNGDNGSATSAQLHFPVGLALDSAGSLYIADSNNFRVRKVTNGVITSVAGNGISGFSGDNGSASSAQLGLPAAVAVDASGNLYIADRNNNCIRRVANGVITTVAGNGTAGYSGDDGPATSAQLNAPGGVAVDSGGRVYIADTGNNRIRILTPSPFTPIAVQTSPPGLQFSIDAGAPQISPQTLILKQGPHTLAVAATQPGACTGYSYSAIATIHHEYVVADASNYTVTVSGTWPALATVGNGGKVTNANGYDICFATPSNSSMLNWELESYNPATGTLVAHVMVGQISSSVDTIFLVFAGNASIGAFQGRSVSAWDSTYAGVWHFGDISASVSDSSPNANHLTNNGATSTAGRIGGAARIGSAAMSGAPSNSLDFSGPMSVSFWENPDKLGYPVLASRTACGVGNWQIYDDVGGGGLYFNFWSGSANQEAFSRFALRTGVWSHVVITYDGSVAAFYVNGVLWSTVALSGTRNANAAIFNVGTDSCSSYLHGSLDELRIARGAWPATLIQTMYSNQSDPGTVVTLSAMAPAIPSGAPQGAQYVFKNWSDGGAASHSITVGTSPATYVATFDTQTTGMTITGVEGGALSAPAVTAISANGYFTIFGNLLTGGGSSRQVGASDMVNGALPTNLGSTCVNVGSVRAFPTYVSPGQINAVAPVVPATGPVAVSVVANCGSSNEVPSAPAQVPVVDATPEFLYWVHNADGRNPVIAVDALGGDYIGASGLIAGVKFRPARAGDVLTIYGVGFGKTASGPVPGMVPSAADTTPAGYSVALGTARLPVSYVGVTPGSPGLYQVNVTIPAGTAPGNYTIVLRVNGATTPAGAFLTIGQ